MSAGRPRNLEKGGTPMTSREWEVVKLMALGASNQQIGDALGISAMTVKSHVATSCHRLGVKNRVGLAVSATLIKILFDVQRLDLGDGEGVEQARRAVSEYVDGLRNLIIAGTSWRDQEYRAADFTAQPGTLEDVPVIDRQGKLSGYLVRWDRMSADPVISSSEYGAFYGPNKVRVEDGEMLRVGVVTHHPAAAMRAGWAEARDHYGGGEPVAVVRCWDDDTGIAIAGVLVAAAGYLKRHRLASGRHLNLSGDWRHRGEGMELAAIVAFPDGGYHAGPGGRA